MYGELARCGGCAPMQHRCDEIGRYRIVHRDYPDTTTSVCTYACRAHLGKLVALRSDTYPTTVTDLLAEPHDTTEDG
jgi:hypothetical protein